MKLLEYIMSEQFVRDLILAVIVVILVSLSKKLGVLSWQWGLHFIRTTRRQRRYLNYVEVRRRVQQEYYLSWKEDVARALGSAMLVLCFLLLLMIGYAAVMPRDPHAQVLLILAVGGLGAAVVGIVAVETSRNLAARAIRAGLTRDRRTKTVSLAS
jgi:hypothetical protein